MGLACNEQQSSSPRAEGVSSTSLQPFRRCTASRTGGTPLDLNPRAHDSRERAISSPVCSTSAALWLVRSFRAPSRKTLLKMRGTRTLTRRFNIRCVRLPLLSPGSGDTSCRLGRTPSKGRTLPPRRRQKRRRPLPRRARRRWRRRLTAELVPTPPPPQNPRPVFLKPSATAMATASAMEVELAMAKTLRVMRNRKGGTRRRRSWPRWCRGSGPPPTAAAAGGRFRTVGGVARARMISATAAAATASVARSTGLTPRRPRPTAPTAPALTATAAEAARLLPQPFPHRRRRPPSTKNKKQQENKHGGKRPAGPPKLRRRPSPMPAATLPTRHRQPHQRHRCSAREAVRRSPAAVTALKRGPGRGGEFARSGEVLPHRRRRMGHRPRRVGPWHGEGGKVARRLRLGAGGRRVDGKRKRQVAVFSVRCSLD